MGNRIQIDLTTARRYLLAHQGLLKPRSLADGDVIGFFNRVGCIQFDPLDVVGRNPDLVLQARVKNYTEDLLHNLLYKDRSLIDGWDKLMSIYKTSDWPYFRRRRDEFSKADTAYVKSFVHALPGVMAEVEKRGPVSTSDIGNDEKVDWHWGPARVAKAALELLWNRGDLVIERKVRVRRIYDLAARHLPADLLSSPEPIPDDDDHRAWHVLRRIGSVGLLPKLAGDEWHGLWGTKTPARREAIDRLLESGSLTEVTIDQVAAPYFVRSSDLPHMQAGAQNSGEPAHATILAPLDNLMWGRKNILKKLFNFDYTWEVYKPATERKYGYYVLPVLHGDRFIARFEPSRRGEKILGIQNWWWEEGVKPDADMKEALISCFQDFLRFVHAEKMERRGGTIGERSLAWINKVRRA